MPQPAPDFPWNRPDSLPAFGAALRARREELHLTLDVLAKITAISKPYLSNIETARAPGPPSEEKLRRIAHALKIPAAELVNGADWLRAPASMRRALAAASAGDHLRRPDGAVDLDAIVGSPAALQRASAPRPAVPGSPSPDAAIPLRSVPLINRVRAGHASEFTDLNYPAGVADDYVPAPDLPHAPAAAAFALRITGDSMSPEYHDGDIIIVGPPPADAPPQDGDDCVVRLGELEQFATTFKRIYFTISNAARGDADAEPAQNLRPDTLRLVPLNPDFPERAVPLEQVTGIYPLLYRLTPPRKKSRPAQIPSATSLADAPNPARTFTTSHVSLEND